MTVLKKPDIQYYSKETIENYKQRLAKELVENALDCDYVAENSDVRDFISNYVENEFFKNDMKYKLQGISHKFINIHLSSYNINSENIVKLYPIINKYKGHSLIESMYFSKDDMGTLSLKTVPVIAKSIIL